MTKEERTMHAKTLKDNQFLQDVLAQIEKDVIKQLKSVDTTNFVVLSHLTIALQQTHKVNAYIKRCIDDERINEFRI